MNGGSWGSTKSLHLKGFFSGKIYKFVDFSTYYCNKRVVRTDVVDFHGNFGLKALNF